MNLRCVTISGADDQVDIDELINLSKEFPFVEWGILMSPNNFGKARYPSRDWISRFIKTPVKKSIHLCGDFARVFATGEIKNPASMPFSMSALLKTIDQFDRVQINLARELNIINSKQLTYNIYKSNVWQFLLQIQPGAGNLINNLNMDLGDLMDHKSVLPFMDISGGQGLPGLWKLDFEWNNLRGFTGKIDPINVKSIVTEISKHNQYPFWIDMESGVRTNDKFNSSLVREVLNNCLEFYPTSS